MKKVDEIWRLLPVLVQNRLKNENATTEEQLEEIRLRTGSPVEMVFSKQTKWMEDLIFTENDSMYVLNQLSEHSMYRMQPELKAGYVTTRGGHRVGLAGAVTTEKGTIKQLQHITFFNIRIAKEIKGTAQSFLPYLRKKQGLCNTLLIGAPQTGKTTILRDLARLISNGCSNYTGLKVGMVDERSEIAASYKGRPQHSIGRRTDVMDACPKADGLMMMIRSMSPEVLIADEIGSRSDVQALLEAVASGVNVIVTVHGNSLSSVQKRPSLEPLFASGMFERFIVLERNPAADFFYHIMDTGGMTISSGKVKER